MARTQGTVSLVQNTAKILSSADRLKKQIVLWIPAAKVVFIGATAATVAVAATRVQLEADKTHYLPCGNEDIYGYCTDVAGADIGVWDVYSL